MGWEVVGLRRSATRWAVMMMASRSSRERRKRGWNLASIVRRASARFQRDERE